jgi:hypothetical protein
VEVLADRALAVVVGHGQVAAGAHLAGHGQVVAEAHLAGHGQAVAVAHLAGHGQAAAGLVDHPVAEAAVDGELVDHPAAAAAVVLYQLAACLVWVACLADQQQRRPSSDGQLHRWPLQACTPALQSQPWPLQRFAVLPSGLSRAG